MSLFTSFVFRPSSLVYGILLLAFFLRAYRLADKNVWWDEGWSVWLSQKDVAWIALRTAMDEHPPLHYWLLHFWNFVAGTDAFAGRFISVFFGVLTVALLYRIGKKMGGVWIGVLATFLLAIARFHIWWSQDIKNYTPSIFFAFAAVWFALQILDVRQQTSDQSARLSLLAYALCAALALWTHYLAALVLLAINLYAIFVLRPPSSVLRPWFIANLLAAALFAPWLILYLQNAAEWTAAPAFDFITFLKLVAAVLPLGVTTNIDNYVALTLAFTVLASFGVIGGQWLMSRKKLDDSLSTIHHPLLFALIVILPPLFVYVLSLTPVSFFAPKIQARYLLILLPAYAMLLAFGIALLRRFSRWLAVAATIFVVGANVWVLNDYYADRRLRDEYTTLANTINAFARQGDLVLLNTDQEWPTFLYYLRYPLDWLGVPNGKAMTKQDADALVRRALARHDAVWLVTIPDALATDPQKLLEARLARELPQRFAQTFDDKRLLLYARDDRNLMNVAPENFAPQYPRVVKLDEHLTLLGFDLPVREARAGDTLRLVTYWRATDTATAQLVVRGKSFVRTHGERLETGERIRLQTDVVIPPTSSDELSISTHDIELVRIRVEPRVEHVRVNEITQRVDYRLGDAIYLIGFDLPTLNLKPNETLNLTLYWRAERLLERNYTVFVHIVGEQFNPKQNNPLWGQADRVPTPAMTAWRPHEIVPDAYAIKIDPEAPPGKYQIAIGMYDTATGARLPTNNGNDSVILADIQITH